MSAAQMSKRERVRATIARQEVDRNPVTFWHHFPDQDLTEDELVQSTLDFQKRYDLDIVKVMPTGMFCTLDYGTKIALSKGDVGTSELVSGPIGSVQDWARLPVAAPDRGAYGAQVGVIRRLREELGPDVAIVGTMFSPLTIAGKLGGNAFKEHLASGDPAFEAGLRRLAEDSIAWGKACFDAGADGFFYGLQNHHLARDISEDAFERYEVAYDLMVLKGLAEHPGNWLSILNIHGAAKFFDLADRYPVEVMNWNDRRPEEPSIREAKGMTRRALMAGLSSNVSTIKEDPADLIEEARDAIAQAAGYPLIVSTGSAVPARTIKEKTLVAMRRSLD